MHFKAVSMYGNDCTYIYTHILTNNLPVKSYLCGHLNFYAYAEIFYGKIERS